MPLGQNGYLLILTSLMPHKARHFQVLTDYDNCLKEGSKKGDLIFFLEVHESKDAFHSSGSPE